MKKILALTLTGLIAVCGSTAFTATAETDDVAPAAASSIYLVPGTYSADGQKVENVIPSGADKLGAEDCAAIYTDNAYLCTLAEGEKLPVPVSERKDGAGNAYAFNGWWSIVDATVTYFDTVPSVTETTFLYADWRADLSQRKDPVEPDGTTVTKPKYYMSVKHKGAEEEEIIALNVSGTDSSEAYQFGYGAPVQFYNEWFSLQPEDEITVYTTGLGGSETPCVSPITISGKFTITLEKSAEENNNTADYLSQVAGTTAIKYTGTTSRHFRIYVKFYDEGGTMTVYMQPKD